MKEHSLCYQFSRTVMGEHVPLDNLRLELTPSCFLILPYHHMELARFESGNAADRLTISFLRHHVRISGRNLRNVAVAIQGRAVEWLKPVVDRYSPVVGPEACFIESIEIDAIEAE